MDVAKVADIVLLMIDGNFGFEMETMEFLSALSTSGMPGNVFGILTHLDLFKKQSALRMAKKRLKQRLWAELYQGAKLFYLSGVINGRYPDREVHNLSRFLSVMKNPRPLIWRNSHPYCLADRFLDITAPTTLENNAKCDREIALYGYLRGTNFPADNARVHIPGVGDLSVREIEALPDPCPTPRLDQAIAKTTGKTGRRRLGEKQKLLFAPMSDVGGVLVDKDAVYIDVKTSTFDRNDDDDEQEDRGLGEQLMLGLQGERRLLGEAGAGMRLLQTGGEITNAGKDEENDMGRSGPRSVRIYKDTEEEDKEDPELLSDEHSEDEVDEEDDDDLDDDDIDLSLPVKHALNHSGDDNDERPGSGELAFADSDSEIGSMSSSDDEALTAIIPRHGSDEDEDEDGAVRWKENMAANARRLHSMQTPYRAADLSRMLYDESLSPREVVRRWKGQSPSEATSGALNQTVDVSEASGDDEDEEFFSRNRAKKEEDDEEDRLDPRDDLEQLAQKWQDPAVVESISRRFIKNPLASDANATRRNEGENDEEAPVNKDSDEGDGEFEDLEADSGNGGEANSAVAGDLDAERARNAKRKEELKLRFEEEDREGFANIQNKAERPEGEKYGEDEWYDAQKATMQKQLDINRAELDYLDPLSRRRAEGFKAGMYARIVLDRVPCEFAQSFDARNPIIVGGLSATEERLGYVQVRIKRHRWHKKILKSNDPLTLSLGWRRFQTLPIYSTSDSRTRNRMLKYTPEHMHCFGTFYGPMIAPNTGFTAVQSFSNSNPGFRIAAVGTVLNVDETTEMVKKLKLTGYPYRIFRNTAFIRDMFSSALEVAKFEGASIRTVSGVRGQIKRALGKPEGHFRATFEDKILMSDIVFLRAWYPIRPHRFYNPVTNLLELPSDEQHQQHQQHQQQQQQQRMNQGQEDNLNKSWPSMRLTGAIRHSLSLPPPTSSPSARNSAYPSHIDRPTRHFNPLRIPTALAAALPFKSQQAQTSAAGSSREKRNPTNNNRVKQPSSSSSSSYLQHRRRGIAIAAGSVPIGSNMQEKRARDLMLKLATIRNDKVEKRRQKKEQRKEGYREVVRQRLEKKKEREKEGKERYFSRSSNNNNKSSSHQGGSRPTSGGVEGGRKRKGSHAVGHDGDGTGTGVGGGVTDDIRRRSRKKMKKIY